MKYEFNGHMIVAKAETQADNVTLLGLMEVAPRKVRAVKPHKKHLFAKQCPECTATFKGTHGLSVHRSLVHGVRSPLFEYNKQYKQKSSKPAEDTGFKLHFLPNEEKAL